MKTVLSILVTAGAILVAINHGNQTRPDAETAQCVVDEAQKDAGFLLFRTGLLQVIRARDFPKLVPNISPDVYLEPGLKGIAAMKTQYRPDDPASPIWNELETILALGGRFNAPDVYCAPFFSCPAPDNSDLDTWFVVKNGVPVHSRPLAESEILTRVSCATVRASGRGMPAAIDAIGWTSIVLPARQWGYVESQYLRSPHDLRAGFVRRNGNWLLASLSAGV